MKSTIVNPIVIAALLFNGAALAAGEMERKAQPAAVNPVTAASAVPSATVAKSPPPTPAQKPHPGMKRSTSGKLYKSKPVRSKSLDLRHCLELENNVAIAKCAGE